MSSSVHFTVDDTKKVQNNVRELLDAMPAEFREHLMHSFLWSKEKLDAYLSREMELDDDQLKDAYSHVESFLARIESYAAEKAPKPFPAYDEWVENEYKNYRASLTEDRDDIERLMDEGGVVAPGKTSPVDTMENDSLSHYNHLKSEHEKTQKRSEEALALMQLSYFKSLKNQALEMCKVIMESMHKH